MNHRCRKALFFLLVLFIGIFLTSCTSIRAGLYLVSIDENNGDDFILSEPFVKKFLESAIESSEEYTIKAYARIPINYRFKRTRLLEHYFYVLSNICGNFYTMSFYGTDFTFNSMGVWTFNSDSDYSSYEMYLAGNNKWDVGEIFSEYVIDVRKTLINIIDMIDRDTPFYYRDHRKDKPNAYNCITALLKTIAFIDTADAQNP